MFGKDEIPLPAPLKEHPQSAGPDCPETPPQAPRVRPQNHVAQEPREHATSTRSQTQGLLTELAESAGRSEEPAGGSRAALTGMSLRNVPAAATGPYWRSRI